MLYYLKYLSHHFFPIIPLLLPPFSNIDLSLPNSTHPQEKINKPVNIEKIKVIKISMNTNNHYLMELKYYE